MLINAYQCWSTLFGTDQLWSILNNTDQHWYTLYTLINTDIHCKTVSALWIWKGNIQIEYQLPRSTVDCGYLIHSAVQIHTEDLHSWYSNCKQLCGSTVDLLYKSTVWFHTLDLYSWYSNSISIYVDPLYWSTLQIHTADPHCRSTLWICIVNIQIVYQ